MEMKIIGIVIDTVKKLIIKMKIQWRDVRKTIQPWFCGTIRAFHFNYSRISWWWSFFLLAGL